MSIVKLWLFSMTTSWLQKQCKNNRVTLTPKFGCHMRCSLGSLVLTQRKHSKKMSPHWCWSHFNCNWFLSLANQQQLFQKRKSLALVLLISSSHSNFSFPPCLTHSYLIQNIVQMAFLEPFLSSKTLQALLPTFALLLPFLYPKIPHLPIMFWALSGFCSPLQSSKPWSDLSKQILHPGTNFSKTPWKKSNLRKKVLLKLTLPGNKPLLRKIREEIQNKKLESRADADHGGTMFTCLFPIACSACFLIHTRTTCPGMDHPVSGHSHTNPQSWKHFKEFSTSQSYGDVFWIRFLLPTWLCLVSG